LGPVAANGVSEVGSAAAIGGDETTGDCGCAVGCCGGLTEHRFARSSSRGRAADGRGGVSSFRSGRSSVLASILAAVSYQAVAISAAAVAGVQVSFGLQHFGLDVLPVRRAATSVRTVGVTGCSSKVLSASTVVPRRGSDWGRRCNDSGRRRRSIVATSRLTALGAVGWRIATPPVLGTACAGVGCAFGVAKQVAVGRAALAVSGVLRRLSPGWNHTTLGSRDKLGKVALEIWYASAQSQICIYMVFG
jgi:hypothetical protein